MLRNCLVLTTVLFVVASTAAGCGSDEKKTTATKKPATGQAVTATKKDPPRTPPPQQKVSTNIGANQSTSAKTDQVCTSADEGKGACVDEFVVFCAGGVLWALDCAAAFNGTCGETNGSIDCLIEEAVAE